MQTCVIILSENWDLVYLANYCRLEGQRLVLFMYRALPKGVPLIYRVAHYDLQFEIQISTVSCLKLILLITFRLMGMFHSSVLPSISIMALVKTLW